MDRSEATFKKYSSQGVDWAAWFLGIGLGLTLALQVTTIALERYLIGVFGDCFALRSMGRWAVDYGKIGAWLRQRVDLQALV